jgi:2,3-diketo-5-methylthio-1-phosphopentane phosphatase
MSQDLKIPYLKSLQGYLWLQGYQTGALRCPLFLDVEPRLQAWHRASIPIIIYSSGSVPAQKLLFQYTNSTPEADLRNLISDYFDTVNAGPKAEKESYEKISSTRDVEIGKWLFLSDNVKEVTAARQAGMQSWIVFREGNPPLSKEDMEGENIITSFEEIPAGKTDESDFRKREREELETDDITPTDQVKRRRKGEPDELVEWNGFEKGKAKGMGEPEDKPKGLETLLDVEGKGVETVAAHPSVSLQSTEAGPDTEDASGKFNAATKVDRSAS